MSPACRPCRPSPVAAKCAVVHFGQLWRNCADSIRLKNAPAGFNLGGAVLPAGQDQVRLTLTVPAQPQPQREPLSLNLEGRATIAGQEVTRRAVPAEDMMQAFFYRHLVPAQDLKVAIRRGGFMFRAPIKVSAGLPLQIPAGGATRFQVQLPMPPNSPIEKVGTN